MTVPLLCTLIYNHKQHYTIIDMKKNLNIYIAMHTSSYMTTQLMICSFMNSKVEKQQYEDIATYVCMSC